MSRDASEPLIARELAEAVLDALTRAWTALLLVGSIDQR